MLDLVLPKCLETVRQHCRSVQALRQHCRCVLRTLRQCCRSVLLPKCLATEVSVKHIGYGRIIYVYIKRREIVIVSAAAVHLWLGRSTWSVVRLRHDDLHRILRVLRRCHNSDCTQDVQMRCEEFKMKLTRENISFLRIVFVFTFFKHWPTSFTYLLLHVPAL